MLGIPRIRTQRSVSDNRTQDRCMRGARIRMAMGLHGYSAGTRRYAQDAQRGGAQLSPWLSRRGSTPPPPLHHRASAPATACFTPCSSDVGVGRGARLGGRDTGQSIRFFRRGNECPSHFPVHHSHASRPNFLHSAGDTECSIFGPASKLVRTRKREGHSSRGGWQSMDCWHRGG